MAGKAERRGGIVDYLKLMDSQTQQNYGLARAAEEGAPHTRNYSIGTAQNDHEGGRLLSIFGGVMLGALGYNKVGTEQLAASGIVDTGDYNASRLTINNNGGYDLKVLVPIYKAGQQVWISALIGQSWDIQNTSGNGDETTGNIELLQQTDYTMTDNDWICFQYDANDEKFHQVSAGINDVGASGSSEVFTWTADHSAGNNDLDDVESIFFNYGSTYTMSIRANTAGFMYQTNQTHDWHNFYVGGTTSPFLHFQIQSTKIYSYLPHDFYDLAVTSVGSLSMTTSGDIDMNAGNINDLHELNLNGGNKITTDGSGNLEYSLTSSLDVHQFFVGSERFRISNSDNFSFNDLNMAGNAISDCLEVLNSGIGGIQMSTSNATSILDSGGIFLTSNGTSSPKTTITVRDFIPLTDDTYDLGANGAQFKDLYIDGVAYIDELNNSGDITLGTDLDIETGATIDFHDIDSSSHSSGGAPALPAQPTAYFVVKYRGGTRYIPYYS